MPTAVRRTEEQLTYELGAVHELCRISEVCLSPVLKKYANEFRAREKALESELRLRRQSRKRRVRQAPRDPRSGSTLFGAYRHECHKAGFLTIDETCPEFLQCTCYAPTSKLRQLKDRLRLNEYALRNLPRVGKKRNAP